ncbi:MAG: stage II sporulation protein M [Anaerolineae bacterium]|jgi:uncharacterized membrane protein SpoIIM required for sporulation/ABC-type transport system involved in multi-copper enzyme maturation permease subunit
MVGWDATRARWQRYVQVVLAVTLREIRDVLRDWRLLTPILILTLLFPVLANFTAREILSFVERHGASVIGERSLPFLLMVVGFFPVSFSLVIALETFVGEKERKSLEPLLASPLSDGQLYLGKTLAAMILPVAASYTGISAYLAALYFLQGWAPSGQLVLQIVALTTAEALVMVSGAVVISSQTTSVRAANLLASFIIIPMALLIQGEAAIMFWGRYGTLWWILAFLLVVNVLLVRMGIRLFNREELLGRDIDTIRIGQLWQTFRHHLAWDWWFFGRDPESLPRPVRWCGFLTGLYLREIPAVIRRSRAALLVILMSVIGAVAVGRGLAIRYPLPAAFLPPDTTPGGIGGISFTASQRLGITPLKILEHNLRALTLGALLGTFSFGSLAVAVLMVTLTISVYLGFQVAWAGYSPFVFFLSLVAPHGVLELPAAVMWTALGVRLGATFVAPPRGMMVREAWLQALADFVKFSVAVALPMLAIAAWIESYITPWVATWVYGG